MPYKVCSAHQPAFLPWAGTIHKVAISDVFVVMDLAKFRKRAFMHRNRIEINAAPHFVGIRVSENADYGLCDQVCISEHHSACLNEIAKKLERTYRSFQYFSDLEDFIETVLLRCEFNDLNRICLSQLQFICKRLEIKTSIVLESQLMRKEELAGLDASHRLLEHALRTNSNVYITGVNSRDYLDASVFEPAHILHQVQGFDYLPFMSCQESPLPLSIVHQIAVLGYERLHEELVQKQKLSLAIKGNGADEGVVDHGAQGVSKVPSVSRIVTEC